MSLVGVSVALSILMGFSGINLERSPLDFSRIEDVKALYGTGVSMAYTIALGLGVLLVTAEYQSGTIGQTLLANPRRVEVYGAKVLAGAVSGLGFGIVTVLITAFAVFMLMAGAEYDAFLGDPVVIMALAGTVLSVVFWTMIGVGVGAIVQNQLAAVMVVILWTQVIEPMLRIVVPGDAVSYLPGSLTDSISGGTVLTLAMDNADLGQVPAALALLGMTAVTVAIGMIRFHRYQLR